MHTDTSAAETLAKRLLEQNRSGRSWRKIAREDYGGRVNFATLNRIAIHGGKWLPKDKKILDTLGLLVHKRADEHTKRIRRHVRKMAHDVENPEQWTAPEPEKLCPSR